MHLGHLLGSAFASCREQRDVSRQAQDADLRIQRSRVRRGDVGEADLAIEYARDRRQVDAELAQGAHERHPRDGAGFIEAVATLAARRRDDEAAIGIEAQRAHRDAAAPRELADCDEVRFAVHSDIVQPPAGGESSDLLSAPRVRPSPTSP